MGLSGFRGRVVVLAVVIGVTTAALLVLASFLWLHRVTEADARALAHTRAESVASLVTVRNGRVSLTEAPNEALDSVTWVYADGRLLDGAVPPDIADAVGRLAASQHPVDEDNGGYLLHQEVLPTPQHHVAVVVRVDLTPFRTSEANGLTLTIVLGAVTVALAWVFVGRALRVVHQMASLANEWGDHDPGQRFHLGRPRDEFGELARTLDGLLDRVESVIADERRLTDEIAHELRTPLTALRGEAQLADLSGTGLPPKTVLCEVDRLNAAVTTILDAARRRLDNDHGCDLREALRRSIAGRAVELSCPRTIVVATSSNVVASIVSPLLDNAVRHARSHVEVRAGTTGEQVTIDVLDDGPGFSPSEVAHAFDPGHTTGSGHGLGLSLVRRVAAAAGAEVQAIPAGHGHVKVVLPAASVREPVRCMAGSSPQAGQYERDDCHQPGHDRATAAEQGPRGHDLVLDNQDPLHHRR